MELKGERIERVVDIYESIDAHGCHKPQTEIKPTGDLHQHKGADSFRSRWCRLIPVCLVLLFILLLVSIIVLLIKYTSLTTDNIQLQARYSKLTTEKVQLQVIYNNLSTENIQLQARYSNLTTENVQLQVIYNNLSTENIQLEARYSNLSSENVQLQARYSNLSSENVQLQARYSNLSSENVQLQGKKDELQTVISKLGVKYFNFSIYWITDAINTWSESRKTCKAKKADLVIINSREEQEFIHQNFKSDQAWIGLSDSAQEGIWKWIDNSLLTTSFWWNGEPNDYGNNEDCGITNYKSATSNISTWADFPCNFPVFGICEM